MCPGYGHRGSSSSFGVGTGRGRTPFASLAPLGADPLPPLATTAGAGVAAAVTAGAAAVFGTVAAAAAGGAGAGTGADAGAAAGGVGDVGGGGGGAAATAAAAAAVGFFKGTPLSPRALPRVTLLSFAPTRSSSFRLLSTPLAAPCVSFPAPLCLLPASRSRPGRARERPLPPPLPFGVTSPPEAAGDFGDGEAVGDFRFGDGVGSLQSISASSSTPPLPLAPRCFFERLGGRLLDGWRLAGPTASGRPEELRLPLLLAAIVSASPWCAASGDPLGCFGADPRRWVLPSTCFLGCFSMCCARSERSVSSPSIAVFTAVVGDLRPGSGLKLLRRPRRPFALSTVANGLTLLRLMRSPAASQSPLALLLPMAPALLLVVLLVMSYVVSFLPPNNGAIFDLFDVGEVTALGEDRGGSGSLPRRFCLEGAWRLSIALVRGVETDGSIIAFFRKYENLQNTKYDIVQHLGEAVLVRD